jgi:type IV secretion system protein VirB1
MLDCPNLAVPLEIMQHVINVESSQNPFAIGVVGGRLARQPRNLSEAVATSEMLQQKGYNFSVGIAQVNRYNLKKYGLSSFTQAFSICENLQAGSKILNECYRRSKGDWGKAFSCYYSGNFVTGYRHGYVQKVFRSIQGAVNHQVLPITAQREQPVKTIREAVLSRSAIPSERTIKEKDSALVF